jgi:hypothetical protein
MYPMMFSRGMDEKFSILYSLPLNCQAGSAMYSPDSAFPWNGVTL